MPKRTPIDRHATAFASATERQLAQLRKSLMAAQDSIAGLRGSVKVPVPKGGRRSTRGTRSNPSILERAGISSVGNFLGRGLTDEIGLGSGSFYASSAQMSSFWSDILQQGQRIL